MYEVDYWDEVAGEQKKRPATAEETAEINARRAAGPSAAEHNAPILKALEQIDLRTIRALREGDQVRIAALDAEAAQLRSQLRKDTE